MRMQRAKLLAMAWTTGPTRAKRDKPAHRIEWTGFDILKATSARTPQRLRPSAEDLRARDHTTATVDALLGRLAHSRTGRGEIDAAFEPDELRRVRSMLLDAAQANGQLARPRATLI